MLEDKYLQSKLHNTQKQEMQTDKRVNRKEVQSTSRLSEGTLKDEMNDCQPKERRRKKKKEIHWKSTQNML